jgi:pilus assembly protein CpaC
MTDVTHKAYNAGALAELISTGLSVTCLPTVPTFSYLSTTNPRFSMNFRRQNRQTISSRAAIRPMYNRAKLAACSDYSEGFSVMTPISCLRGGLRGPALGQRLVFAALLAWAGWVSCSNARAQPCCAPSGSAPVLPPVPLRSPRPEAVSSFVNNYGANNDAAFEVFVGQSRILTLKEDLAVKGKQLPLIAVGDPSLIEFTLINPRQIRVLGRAIGVTDLSITTADGQAYGFEVRVTADLDMLRAKLHCLFPDASIKLSQLREHIVVEGQARDTVQVGKIIETTNAYLRSIQTTVSDQKALQPAQSGTGLPPGPGLPPGSGPEPGTGPQAIQQNFVGDAASRLNVPRAEVINLLHVPGPQQVLLKVRVAELNRTGMRQIGADFLSIDPKTGAIVGSQIGGAGVSASAAILSASQTAAASSQMAGSSLGDAAVSAIAAGAGRLTGQAATAISPQTTLFGIFQEGDFAVFLSALRRNSLLKLLAEPNLVALNGQQASFLAGGQFPVPVAQSSSGGAAPAVTVQFQPFGVSLAFLPVILDDDTIRLTVDPEVSTIDFSIGTTLVPGGSVVPGLSTRKAHTVVELHQGQTLAIAGLMQLSLDGNTSRIPGLGDLPIIGPFFSNTTSQRIEKELIVLVTPYLVEPMNAGQVPPVPGDEVNEPNDLEFYLLNRIQGRTGRDFRDTIEYDDALHVVRCLLKLEKDHVRGPFGFCD